jgi:hypothetical protein
MYSSKSKLSTDDDQEKTSVNPMTSISSDVDLTTRSYALIETDADELEHIIDLLRQFFPRTKIIEYKSYRQRSSSETEEQISSNVNSPVKREKKTQTKQRICLFV